MARLASHSKLTSLATALVIAYAAGLVTYLLSLLGPVHNAEQGTLDWRFLFRGPMGEKPAGMALVTIDEDADLPYWAPVPRDHLAQVVRVLSEGGARLIGLDFFLGKYSFDARGDSLLRTAIGEAGNVVLASFVEWDEEGQPKEHKPLPFFSKMALDYGYATFFTDTSVESVREGRVAIGLDEKHILSLAGCLLARAKGLDTDEIRQLPWSKRHPELPGDEEDYRRIIDFNGPPFQYYRSIDREMPGGLVTLSSHQVINLPPPLVKQFFADRIVLIGSGLDDAPDRYRTPFFAQKYGFRRTFGVEIHGQFLHTLLADRQPERAGFFLSILLVLGPAFLAALASVRMRAYGAFLLVLGILLVLWILGFYSFQSWSLVVPLVTPTLACGLACLLGLIYVGSTDGRRKNEARERFAPLVGSEQLEDILAQPESWSTEGEEQNVTVLWIELPSLDYETVSARETVTFFQNCWEELSSLIFNHGGAVFRYEEDGLGVVFGAPLEEKEHPERAIDAAIELVEAWLGGVQRGTWERGLRIGGDTGRVFVGELAGGERYAYRVLGRPVERALMLARDSDGEAGIRISRELWEQVRDRVEANPWSNGAGEVGYLVKGRTASPPIGAAAIPDNPFWKYLGLDRRRDDEISEELLERLALFKGFNRRDLRQIVPLLYHRTFSPQERVFVQGEVGSAMYIIQKGSVDILKEGEDSEPAQLLQRFGKGEFFGELALLSDVRRSASAVAYEPAELLVLFQSDLYDLIEREPELGVRLIRTLSRIVGERLIRTSEELVRRNPTADREGEPS